MDFDALAAEHRDRVYREMVRVCGGRDDAEDALAEALLSAYRHLDALDEPAAFRAWLSRIARRVCGRMKSRQALRPVLSLAQESGEDIDLASEEPTAQDLAWESQLQGCLHEALRQLPEESRRAYTLFEIEGRSLEEAAEAEGVTTAAFKSRLHRARLRLRSAIEETVCASALP